MHGVPSFLKSSFNGYWMKDDFIVPSSNEYPVKDATAVEINTADVVLMSFMQNIDTWYQMSIFTAVDFNK